MGHSIAIRYFAAAAEAAGREEESLVIDGDASLGSLKAMLESRYGVAMQAVLNSGSFLVDGVVRRNPEQRLGSRVDVLPPFAGG